MKAMLFAAGLGTRLKPFTDDNPKALAKVNGHSLLELNIRYLQRFGITDVVVNVHHFADKIESVLAANNNFGSSVSISDERDEVLETGGGLKKAAPFFRGEEAFVVMNVDILTDLDLGKLIENHRSSGAAATLAVMDRPSSRRFLFDGNMILCGWQNNTTGEQRISRTVAHMRPLAFSGVQVVSQALLNSIPFSGKFSLVDVYLQAAKTTIVKGFDHTGDLFIDVGKPESLQKAEQLFR